MNKPKKRTREYLDYNECAKWIENKYKVDLRNYAGKKFTGKPDDPPYQDFWHYIVDSGDVSNGCFFYLDLYYIDGCTDWQKEILKMFKDEFEEYIEGTCIEFWVDW